MTFTFVQSHMSSSNVQKLAKIKKMTHILNAILSKDFIFDTQVQPIKAHSTTQVTIKFSLKWVKHYGKQLAISLMLIHLQTLYLVATYNPLRRIQLPKCRWPWPKRSRSKVKVIGEGQIFP